MAAADPFVICLDLDDTIVITSQKYHRAIWKACLAMCEGMGRKSLYPSLVMERLLAAEHETARIFGFSRDRPRIAMETAYRRVCVDQDAEPREGVIREFALICEELHREKHPLIPNAGAALQLLRADGHELHCITSGDLEMQLQKIDDVGIAHLFASIEVTKGDKKPIIERIVAGHDKRRAMMVGDSRLRDIKPAIELGILPVFVPGDTWPIADCEVDSKHHWTIESVAYLPPLIAALRALS